MEECRVGAEVRLLASLVFAAACSPMLTNDGPLANVGSRLPVRRGG